MAPAGRDEYPGTTGTASEEAPAEQSPADAPTAPAPAPRRTRHPHDIHAAGRLGFSRRRVGRALRVAGALLAIGVVLLTWAWRATPSTADLSVRLKREIAARHEPYTALAAISPQMQHALIAIEDERFYLHHGIDTIGLLRAAWDDLRAGRIVEGGSTLTAQLAKNAYLHGYDHTVPLKLEDLMLAFKVERHLSKAQILELYLNYVYFGSGAYGIAEASRQFFGITPARLDPAQAALLAGLVQAPGAYDPWCHPRAAHVRQQEVLARMLADGYLSRTQYHQAVAEALPFWQPGALHPAAAACPH